MPAAPTCHHFICNIDYQTNAQEFNLLWQVAPIPGDIQDRRVEITGPVDRKMVINALNSGANVYMADFEDSNAPTWCACSCSPVLLALC